MDASSAHIGATALLYAGVGFFICGFGIYMSIRWMVTGELHPLIGVLAVGVFGGLYFLSTTIQGWIAGGIYLSLIALYTLWPYAETKLIETEFTEIDLEQLEKAHAQLAERPDNIMPWFVIARSVHALGLPGHAVVIAENALNSISDVENPDTHQSLRDMFRNEQQEVNLWRSDLYEDELQKKVSCMNCGAMNPPGEIACIRCRMPFLLDRARHFNPRVKVIGGLVVAWLVLACLPPLGIWSFSSLAAPLSYLSFFGGLAVAGLVIGLVLRKRRLA